MKWSKDNRLLSHLFWGSIFFMLTGICVKAQTPELKFLEVAGKRSNLQILNIEQDFRGYLWLGTNKGILKYDGLDYLEIALPDSLIKSRVSHLSISGDQVVAGFESGNLISFSVLNPNRFSVWNLSEIEITSSAIGVDGSIWVGTNGDGLIRIQGNQIHRYGIGDGLADVFVHDLLFLQEELMIATDLGLSICKINGDKVDFSNRNTESGLTDNLVLSLCVFDETHLLIGMENGTITHHEYHTDQFKSYTPLDSLEISGINQMLILNENILAITESDGALVIERKDPSKIQQFDLGENSRGSKISDCLADEEGNLIIAESSYQLIHADFRIQFIIEHENQPFYNAHCVYFDSNGDILFANEKGIFRHKVEFTKDQFITKVYETSLGDAAIISLCEGKPGEIWFGTFGKGLGMINLNSGKIRRFTEADGLLNNNVLSIAKQGDVLWLATLGGAASLTESEGRYTFQTYDHKSSLSSSYVYCAFVSSQNVVWLGTDGNGPVKYVGGQFQFLKSNFPEIGKSIVSITEDLDGNLWFYSADKGLQYTNGQELRSFPLSVDAENIEVYAIQGDPLGNIVALTSFGIALLNHRSDHISFIIPDRNVSSNFVNVITRDNNGDLWIGTELSMIKFREISSSGVSQPRTILENISVLLQPIDSTQHLYRYDQNHFTFDITSIWFQRPEMISFQTKLEGFDLDWVDTRNRTIVFPSLPPGKYRFMVRSSANEDWENARVESWDFEIEKPYWNRWWFISAMVLLIMLTISALIRVRLNFIKRRESLSRQKVQSQFDTLRNQVNPHFLFNSFNTLISIIEQDSDEAVNYVEKLSDYFRIVLEQRDKDVITLRDELELVKSYLFLQKKRFGENLIYHLNISEGNMSSLVPPLTIQILIENSIKHNVISKLKPLHVTIEEINGKLRIKNNLQPKLVKETSTGIGLENVKNRYRILFGKEVQIKESGDFFTVELPIQNEIQ